MKTSKLFTIDVEIAEKLKNINGSELTNRLLKEHFDINTGKNTLKDEKKAHFDAISKKKSSFLKKLRLLMSGIPLVWIITRKYGLKQGLKSLLGLNPGLILKEGQLILHQKSLKLLGTSSIITGSSSDDNNT